MNLRNVAKKGTEYNVGLKIGPTYVGWAAVDSKGDLLHFKGRPTWGVRLFSEADHASSARVYRGQRRRYDRRRQRLDLLQELFAEEMRETDPEFFVRLNQSRLLREDRDEKHSDYRWPLFNDSDFTEVDYYSRFPTIYHLRTWLMETVEKVDLRLVYLAFHNVVKARGNFLWQDMPDLSASNANVGDAVERMCDAVELWCAERDVKVDGVADRAEIRAVLEDGMLSRKEKRAKLESALGLGRANRKMATAIAGAVLGYVVQFDDIFAAEGRREGTKFSLDKEDKVEEYLAICPDDGLELFEALRMLRSADILLGILDGGDGRTISYHKVDEYERYGEDLKLLKQLVREYVPKSYDAFFRGEHYKDPRWAKDYDPKKVKGYTLYNLSRGRDYDMLRKDIEKLFENTKAVDDERYVQMMEALRDRKFLHRLKTRDNGTIPYQLHLEEMHAIIQRQAKHYPFLLEKQREIESLVTFRIPYYVGPLTQENAAKDMNGKNRFAWSERVEGEAGKQPIRPWNWEEVIDKEASAEAFIRRMTGSCTYLYKEPVLPKCSLLYERFCVLNELNGARYSLDGDKWYRFDYMDRAHIVADLFERSATVTYKKVSDWLRTHNRGINPLVRGGQGETAFESKLSSHRFFCKLLDVDELEGSVAEMVEEIILWNTLFEDRKILRERITNTYGRRGNGALSARQINAICKKRLTGWGRLSRRLLLETKVAIDGRRVSVMDVLEEGDPCGRHIGAAMVFMELLSDSRLGFQKKVDELNRKRMETSGDLTVHDLPGSPALRRGVNQALRVVEEIVTIAGGEPNSIYVETTRENSSKQRGSRTTKRYEQVKAALDALKAESTVTPGLFEELKRNEKSTFDDKLMLYFLQNGRCMYSGKPLDINRMESYQISYIIPRGYIKDDSLDNKVLVLPSMSQRRNDQLLIDESIRKAMSGIWRELHRAGAISDKKYRNLKCASIGDRQMYGYVARQLVERGQASKHVRLLLEKRYRRTKVRPIKGVLMRQLRESVQCDKCREANDYHCAHDALIASEVGRFIQTRFGDIFDNPVGLERSMRDYIQTLSAEQRRTGRMPGDSTFIVGSFCRRHIDRDTGELLWDGSTETDQIRRFLNYKDCHISRMPEISSGKYWNATVYSPKDPSRTKNLPLKAGLPVDSYGTYSGVEYAYFFIYRARIRGKTRYVFEGLPVSEAVRIGDDATRLCSYARRVAEGKGQEFVSIVRRRIPKKQLIEVDGCRLYVAGLKYGYHATQCAFTRKETDIINRLKNPSDTTPAERLLLFDVLCDKIEGNSAYHADKMDLPNKREAFIDAPDDAQAELLLGIINWANGKAKKVNLVSVGGVTNGVVQSIAYEKLINANGGTFYLIDQSVTGMFEQRSRLSCK